MTRPLLILIAGPYRSGTGGDPAAIARNLERLEEAAAPLHRLGHVPMIGEWVALPVLRGLADAGPGAADASTTSEGAATPEGAADGGATATEGGPAAEAGDGDVMYEVARRLLQHCDGVLRLPGASQGADTDVAIARERGLPVWFDLADVPPAA
ncbi:DUF4406 domain-containing protein [Herbiconiux flava]|uniref:DUF4406 domain-containing protein n=1 Tax=Herbiconiux flava TaxID=881268 RepID=A0A852S7Y4_9MICO|nr:DUF4406 domain-containing protein [Herbiconiux flava]NYD69368.1 hypothetical protein [Herbiconiux flava]GLK16114.1 hypothetical protein GCM10017602_05960 [Herbiconiux flava]